VLDASGAGVSNDTGRVVCAERVRGVCLDGRTPYNKQQQQLTLGVQYYRTDLFGSSVPTQIRFLEKPVPIGS
jgi:hypothetical protein